MFGVSKSAGAALAVRLMFILGTFVITTSASATPISFDHFSLVAVNPPRQFETEPIFKEPATGLDVPDFYRGMDETLLPDGYELRGQGVALFYTQNTLFASPDDLITFASPFAATSTLTTALEPGGQPIVNPEPSSLVLLGTGLLLVVKARTFRRRRS